MRRIIFPALAFTLALAACRSDFPTAPAATPDSVQFSENANGRPFKASCRMAIQPPTPVSPGVIRQVDTGECQVSHLGASTLFSDKVINIAAGTQTTQATFTAANGDELRATGSGTNTMVAPGIVRFTADMTFVGGTGRFANASGRATINGEANLAQGRSAMNMSGFINY